MIASAYFQSSQFWERANVCSHQLKPDIRTTHHPFTGAGRNRSACPDGPQSVSPNSRIPSRISSGFIREADDASFRVQTLQRFERPALIAELSIVVVLDDDRVFAPRPLQQFPAPGRRKNGSRAYPGRDEARCLQKCSPFALAILAVQIRTRILASGHRCPSGAPGKSRIYLQLGMLD